ncbi:unnamed protein product [Rotaria sp. Silwood2]|nr:unnamed protein product [Rotaria sp. Silwood2]
MIECTDKLLANWRTRPSQHVHCDIIHQSENLMLAIFGWIAFDYDLETLDGIDNSNELCEALKSFLSIFEFISYMPRVINILYLKLSRRHQRAKKTIGRYSNRIIDTELKQSKEWRVQRKRTSLIASLATSLQEDTEAEAHKIEEEKKGKTNDSLSLTYYIMCHLSLWIGLSRSEVLDEILLLLVAGFETTATALTWFIHLMSKNPRVQQKIKAELNDSSDQQHLSLDRLDSLVYLDCVIKEVLRYSPPASMTFRTLVVDDCLPQSGAQLFKGDQVLIPLHNLAHDNRLWSIDPNLFYPERFLNEDKNHHPYAFIPFGGGHRQCLGKDLATFQFKVVAARLMQFIMFGDGGPEVNSGGQLTSTTTKPRYIGVTINFDQ